MNSISFSGVSSIENCFFVKIAIHCIFFSYPAANVRHLDMKSIFVCIRVDRSCLNSQFLTGTNNPDGNFSAIRNEYSFKHMDTSTILFMRHAHVSLIKYVHMIIYFNANCKSK